MKLRFLKVVSLCFVAWPALNAAAQSPYDVMPPDAPVPRYQPTTYVIPAVKNAPYTLTETSTSTSKRDDGSTSKRDDGSLKIQVLVEHRMRDSEGRQRIELGVVEGGKFRCLKIDVFDPVGHLQMELYESQKAAQVTHFSAPTQEDLAWMHDRLAERDKAASASAKGPDEENLPAEVVEGILVHGKRLHRTWGTPYTTVDTWYSPELQIEMRGESDSATLGHTSRIVADLQRVEPPAELFKIPDGYTVQSQDGFDEAPAAHSSLPQIKPDAATEHPND